MGEVQKKSRSAIAAHNAAAGLLTLLYVGITLMVLVLRAQASTYDPSFGNAALIYFLPLCVMSMMGNLIVARFPSNPIGWILCGFPLWFSANELLYGYALTAVMVYPGLLPAGVPAAMLYRALYFTATLPFILMFSLFPTGRPLSPGWGKLIWAGGVLTVLEGLGGFLEPDPLSAGRVLNPIHLGQWKPLVDTLFIVVFVANFLVLIASVVSLIVRMRRAGSDERQQIKWFVYATAFLPVGFGFLFFGRSQFTDQLGYAFSGIAIAGLCIATGLALFKFHLYEIDQIINRTLVYASLTIVLALVYLGSVVGLQIIFTTLALQPQNDLVTVLSTLAIAALFTPLRRIIQHTLDRRFYRQKFDAGKTLANYNRKLRNEVDLETIAGELISVVEDSLQPEQVKLWMKPAIERAAPRWDEVPKKKE